MCKSCVLLDTLMVFLTYHQGYAYPRLGTADLNCKLDKKILFDIPHTIFVAVVVVVLVTSHTTKCTKCIRDLENIKVYKVYKG